MPFDTRNDVLVRTRDGRNMVIVEPVGFVTEDGRRFRIPIGATSDGCSTPAVMWLKWPPFGPYWLAAVLHDAAYRGTLEVWNGTDWVRANLSKDDCDLLFRESMIALGVDRSEAQTLYDGVHLAGQSSFDGDRNPS